MKIKLKVDLNQEFDFCESNYTMPIIINRTMILGVYNVHFFEMTDNILYGDNCQKNIKKRYINITGKNL